MIWKLCFIKIYILTVSQSASGYVLFAVNIDEFRTLAKKMVPSELADQLADVAASHLTYRQSGEGGLRDEGKTRYMIKNQEKVENLDLDELVKRVKEKLDQEYKSNDKTELNVIGDKKLKYLKDVTLNEEKLPSIDDYYYKDDTMNVDIDDEGRDPSSAEFELEKDKESEYSKEEIDYDNEEYDQQNQNNEKIKIDFNSKENALTAKQNTQNKYANTQNIAYANQVSKGPIEYDESDNEKLESEIEREDTNNMGSVDLTYSHKDNQKFEKEEEYIHQKDNVKKQDGQYLEEKDYMTEYDDHAEFDNQHKDKVKLKKLTQYGDTIKGNLNNNEFNLNFGSNAILKTTKKYDYDKKQTKENENKHTNDPVNSSEIKEVPVYYDEARSDGDLLKEVNLENIKDSYEDYVIPKKENIFASEETTKHEKIQTDLKVVYQKAKTENRSSNKYFKDKITTQKSTTEAVKPKESEIKAKTESLWYDDAKTEENIQRNNTKSDKKLKGTMIPTREFFKMSSPNYLGKIKAVAEKYDFNEPLPERDRERENIKYFGNPPALINKKVVL